MVTVVGKATTRLLNPHTCDSCGQEATGYTQTELLGQGWKFHSLKGARSFVMCGDCEHEYSVRRALHGIDQETKAA